MRFEVEVPAALLEVKEFEHRAELAKAHMQLALYRQVLLDNGIEPPDLAGDELLQLWHDASVVISSASEFVTRLGSAKEFLDDRRWRERGEGRLADRSA